MRIAAAMGVPITGADAHPAKLQRGDGKRGIDIAGTAAANFALAGLHQQSIDPQIVVEPHAHNHVRVLEAQDILRFGLIVLGIHARRNEIDRRDPVAAYGLCKAAQVGRSGYNLDRLLRKSRRQQGEPSGYDSVAQHHGFDMRKGRAGQPFHAFR